MSVVFRQFAECLLTPLQRRNSRYPSTAAWGHNPTSARLLYQPVGAGDHHFGDGDVEDSHRARQLYTEHANAVAYVDAVQPIANI